VVEVVVERPKGEFQSMPAQERHHREAIALTKMAEQAGVSAVSILTSFFIRPNDEELFEHTKRLQKPPDSGSPL